MNGESDRLTLARLDFAAKNDVALLVSIAVAELAESDVVADEANSRRGEGNT